MLQILKSDNISKTDWLYNFPLRITKILYFELNGSFIIIGRNNSKRDEKYINFSTNCY